MKYEQSEGTNMLMRTLMQVLREAMFSMPWTSERSTEKERRDAKADDVIRREQHMAQAVQADRWMRWNR